MATEQTDFPEFISEIAGDTLARTRVLVTGATGFIGRRLVEGLIAAGAKVSVLVRTRQNAKALGSLDITMFPGGLDDKDALAVALKGQEILFHFAYDVRASGRDNLSAFKTLLQAAEQAQVRRIVHASSMVVYDTWPGGVISETSPRTSNEDGSYRDAKIAMEQLLLGSPVSAAILQPGIVFGRGSAMWTDAPRNALRRGPVILPDPTGNCAAIHVDDVVQAAIRAAILTDLKHERFVICGPTQPTWEDFYRAHIAAIGQGEIRLVPMKELEDRLPSPAVGQNSTGSPSLAARISRLLRKLLGRKRFESIVSLVSDLTVKKGPVYPDRQMLGLYSARPDISCQVAKDRLGFDPRIGL